jgi:hypothetical protein
VTTSIVTSTGTNGQTTVYTITALAPQQSGNCDVQGSGDSVVCNSVKVGNAASKVRVNLVQIFLCFAMSYTVLLF